MKLLHIADLHLGRRMNDISLQEDQRYMLKQIADIAAEHSVDAVLIAGDVYQKASPQSEAMTMFNDFVTDLVALGCKIFVISGNHDSDQRISYFSSLIKKSGVYVSERFEGVLQQVALQDEYGDVVISLLPFYRPINLKKCYPELRIDNYADATRAILDNSPIDNECRNVLLMHQFITGAELSDSEERTVGGLDNIDGTLFNEFDYVALGHIHKPQRICRDTMRYAGSPLKYSLSEAEHNKSVALVELREKGTVEIKTIPIEAKHDVRIISGSLEEILEMPYSEDYVQAIVTDEFVPPDARVRITTVFPNMIKYSVNNSKTKTDIDVLAKETLESKNVIELFRDFYMLQSNGVEPTDEQIKLIDELLKEIREDRYEAD